MEGEEQDGMIRYLLFGDGVGWTGLGFFDAEARRTRSEHRGRTGVDFEF